MEMSAKSSAVSEGKKEVRICQGCGQEEVGKMLSCKGCESVWYCNKVSHELVHVP